MAQVKTALITGAAQRIGSEIALELHRAGFDIALHYRSSDAQAQHLAQQLNTARTDSCQLFSADLTNLGDVQRLGGEIVGRYRSLDLLVNNASGFEPTPIQSCSEAAFDAMLASNLKGPYFLIQSLLPALQSTGGAIVNILDVHVEQPLPDFNAYCAAKAGLASLTRTSSVMSIFGYSGKGSGAACWLEPNRPRLSCSCSTAPGRWHGNWTPTIRRFRSSAWRWACWRHWWSRSRACWCYT